MKSWSSCLLRPLLSGLCVLVSGVASGAEQTARLTVELKVQGTEQRRSTGSPDHAEGTFNDVYRFSVTTVSDGELNNINSRDPRFVEQMLALSAAVLTQVERASRGDVVEELPDQEDYRYLDYFGPEDCDSSVDVRIDRRLSGEYADVQGMVPYTVSHRADYSGDDTLRMLLCLNANLVLDVKRDVFFTSGLSVPAAVGTQDRQVQGRAVETAESPIAVQSEVAEWLVAQLLEAPLSGSRQASIKLTRDESGALSVGDYSGLAEVELSWRLERQ